VGCFEWVKLCCAAPGAVCRSREVTGERIDLLGEPCRSRREGGAWYAYCLFQRKNMIIIHLNWSLRTVNPWGMTLFVLPPEWSLIGSVRGAGSVALVLLVHFLNLNSIRYDCNEATTTIAWARAHREVSSRRLLPFSLVSSLCMLRRLCIPDRRD
jgi:hypothetical protein